MAEYKSEEELNEAMKNVTPPVDLPAPPVPAFMEEDFRRDYGNIGFPGGGKQRCLDTKKRIDKHYPGAMGRPQAVRCACLS